MYGDGTSVSFRSIRLRMASLSSLPRNILHGEFSHRSPVSRDLIHSECVQVHRLRRFIARTNRGRSLLRSSESLLEDYWSRISASGQSFFCFVWNRASDIRVLVTFYVYILLSLCLTPITLHLWATPIGWLAATLFG